MKLKGYEEIMYAVSMPIRAKIILPAMPCIQQHAMNWFHSRMNNTFLINLIMLMPYNFEEQ